MSVPLKQSLPLFSRPSLSKDINAVGEMVYSWAGASPGSITIPAPPGHIVMFNPDDGSFFLVPLPPLLVNSQIVDIVW